MPLTVAIIGAGPLGRWLALSAARAGYRVLLEDVMPTNLRHAQEFLRQQLGPEQLAGMLFPAEAAAPSTRTATQALYQGPTSVGPQEAAKTEGALAPAGTPAPVTQEHSGCVAFVTTIEDAVRQADLAIDCVPDELESKLEILWLLDRMAPPRTVLATPTTRLSIADLANCTYRPEKVIAIAAEASALSAGAATEINLRTTSRTSPETAALLDQFWRRLGFTPTFAPDPAEPPPPLAPTPPDRQSRDLNT